ncbi:hypothetical protein GCM10027275_13910 [Rhabdobacter roseus]|uniref:Transcriptional regulator with XRE-family HTH domain n=1 Tax=Rhabdobacter roseus TaxID=1655419 RepID=A0A840TUE7_9BACT|nr:helix-turn-helix transcriptional regulator [Rhabdobacter roseus]MBB5283309.1 transcriptional regulator with XRE-family HTH domain [Rhabdobacter roseus]
MSIVSNNIKYLRRLNGLTQEQFARKIGIKRSLLGAYEEARANPNLTNLKNMALAFGISVDNLLKNDLRRVRETPNLGLPASPTNPLPPPPLMADPMPPQPLSTIIDKYQRARPTIRLVSRPVMLKPVAYQGTSLSPNPPAPTRNAYQPPLFNNQYEGQPASRVATTYEEKAPPQQTIQWVRGSQAGEYLAQYQSTSFLNRLPTFQLPNLPSGHYRAFEAGKDFLFPGALLVGSFIKNWYDIKDGRQYVFVLRNHGIVYRKAYNQVKVKGLLLLSSDIATISSLEVPIGEVLEVWEVNAFVSLQLPEPTPSLDRIGQLVQEMQRELGQPRAGY